MKIVVRIPTEQYAYVEVEFDNISEYQKGYPEFVKAMLKTRAEAEKVKKEILDNQPPF
tara:strand:- start:7 stop:180 length:174 start_codon:yes stop_codon:yes gene_type:complete